MNNKIEQRADASHRRRCPHAPRSSAGHYFQAGWNSKEVAMEQEREQALRKGSWKEQLPSPQHPPESCRANVESYCQGKGEWWRRADPPERARNITAKQSLYRALGQLDFWGREMGFSCAKTYDLTEFFDTLNKVSSPQVLGLYELLKKQLYNRIMFLDVMAGGRSFKTWLIRAWNTRKQN